MTSLFSRSSSSKKKSSNTEPGALRYEETPAYTPPLPVAGSSAASYIDGAARVARASSSTASSQQDSIPMSPGIRSVRSVKSVGDNRERRQRDGNSSSMDHEDQPMPMRGAHRPSSRASNASDSSQSYYNRPSTGFTPSASINSQRGIPSRDPNGTVSSRTTNNSMMTSSTSSYAPSIRSVASSASHAGSSSYSIHSTLAGMATPQPLSLIHI